MLQAAIWYVGAVDIYGRTVCFRNAIRTAEMHIILLSGVIGSSDGNAVAGEAFHSENFITVGLHSVSLYAEV